MKYISIILFLICTVCHGQSKKTYESLEEALKTPNEVTLLRLSGLDSLPEKIGKLKKLSKLGLNFNKLTSLPNSSGSVFPFSVPHMYSASV